MGTISTMYCKRFSTEFTVTDGYRLSIEEKIPLTEEGGGETPLKERRQLL